MTRILLRPCVTHIVTRNQEVMVPWYLPIPHKASKSLKEPLCCLSPFSELHRSKHAGWMEELSRSKPSRRGYRSHITKTYSRITEITDSPEPTTGVQRITLFTALEQLWQKQMLLKELDLKIANGITDAEELAQEMCDTEDYHTALTEKIAYVREFLSHSA